MHNATKKIDEAIRRAYSGFEVEAMVAAAAEQQKFSSATKVDEATTITRADSGMEPRAAITLEQRNPSSSAKKSSSGGSTDASRAGSRIEEVAAQQNILKGTLCFSLLTITIRMCECIECFDLHRVFYIGHSVHITVY
jgi:hypothetical protein